jgi:hypothetical protein
MTIKGGENEGKDEDKVQQQLFSFIALLKLS